MTDRHQQKPYPLRMPEDLRAQLEQAAKAGARSLHSEILARLEASFDPKPEPSMSLHLLKHASTIAEALKRIDEKESDLVKRLDHFAAVLGHMTASETGSDVAAASGTAPASEAPALPRLQK